MTDGNRRILAIDVRPRKIGYAVFEDSARIHDAGTRKMKLPDVAATRIASLLAGLRPSVVILRKISLSSIRYRPRTKMLQRLICRLARRSRIEVVFIGERELRGCFQAHERRTKHEIATLLAKRYPEIAWKLPEKRKIYDREPWSMVVFDAAALGVAYLAKNNGTQLQENPNSR